ncbi:hypothetical protein [Chitinibacter sp. GC72]|uniref:hypothetical protein n=1 Tax=Chitinibacter sp. GC72 TaxID=1526917 RepID=UPI0012F97731|nr:hypothetical protein [Chitinibacter sp. GC72]
MYDCLDDTSVNRAIPAVTHTATPAVVRFQLHLHYREHSRLLLKLAPGAAPAQLGLAYAAALSAGLSTQNLADGSVLIFKLNLDQALSFQLRFVDLLAHYEPARHTPHTA